MSMIFHGSWEQRANPEMHAGEHKACQDEALWRVGRMRQTTMHLLHYY